ncbi:hypothetical protein FXB41_02660 [Bradyrhizobium canariense]|uniref:hypothetical protein n=1 Tax=Bradyrhizobium canariense TaxID=255045 RepID=UPI001CA4B49F|nr:hypothetical protein [Bradyrhizobium canariense]MBW5433735.1 hypothetical protein [Bradyrhizobium canariense]
MRHAERTVRRVKQSGIGVEFGQEGLKKLPRFEQCVAVRLAIQWHTLAACKHHDREQASDMIQNASSSLPRRWKPVEPESRDAIDRRRCCRHQEHSADNPSAKAKTIQ